MHHCTKELDHCLHALPEADLTLREGAEVVNHQQIMQPLIKRLLELRRRHLHADVSTYVYAHPHAFAFDCTHATRARARAHTHTHTHTHTQSTSGTAETAAMSSRPTTKSGLILPLCTSSTYSIDLSSMAVNLEIDASSFSRSDPSTVPLKAG